MFSRIPAHAEGLYDPSYEHDACGVAMVARLDNEPRHEVVDMALDGAGQPRAPRRRGRRHRAPATAPGSSSRCPTRSSARSWTSSCPPPGRYGVGHVLPPARRGAARKLEAAARAQRRASRASGSSAGATCPSTRTTSATRPTPAAPDVQQLFVGPVHGFGDDQDAFERKLYVIRRDRRARRRPRLLRPELLARGRSSTRGCSSPRSCAASTPTCRTSASPRRWRSCTRASRPTRSRAGSSRTRTA